MIGYISGIAGMMISILIIILLVIGLWNSKRHSFNGGVYFFLLLILHEMYSFIAPPLIRDYFDTIAIEKKEPILGMTLGELAVSLSLS